MNVSNIFLSITKSLKHVSIQKKLSTYFIVNTTVIFIDFVLKECKKSIDRNAAIGQFGSCHTKSSLLENFINEDETTCRAKILNKLIV